MGPGSGGPFLLVSVAHGIMQLLAMLLSHENMADVRLSPNMNSDVERLYVILALREDLLAPGFLSLLCSSGVVIDDHDIWQPTKPIPTLHVIYRLRDRQSAVSDLLSV